MKKTHSIIEKFFNHDYPEEIQGQIQHWLINLNEAKEKDKILYEIWNKLDIKADDSTFQAFSQVQKKIRQQPSPIKRRIRSRFITTVAALVTVSVLSALGVYIFNQVNQKQIPQPEEIELTEYFVPNGQIKKTTLPDGTFVTVNSGSILIYPKKFNGQKRNVYLNGQANFVVSRDIHKPFIVKTTNMDIEALGTVFDVSSYIQDHKVSTTLESGSVKVNVKTPGKSLIESLILSPNEQVTFHCMSNKVTKTQINPHYTSAWKQGSLVFQGASINDIITTFERRYDVSIYYNSSKYDKETITVKFVHGETLEESLQILKMIITNFKYKIEGKKIFIN